MPEFRLPTTPEQWAAVEPNETDAALLNSAELHLAYTQKSEFDKHLALAAAARLLTWERCVEALARHPDGGGHILFSSDGTREARIEWARRILEDK